MVRGKEGDSVNLSNSHVSGLSDGEWRAQGTAHIGAAAYRVIEHSGANVELLIGHEIRIELH